MAESQAGQGNAQGQEQQAEQQGQQGEQGQQGNSEQGGEGEGGQQEKTVQGARVYTQEELDRILGKVRKNARYLGRKEAESELRSQGATAQQAREAVDRQQQEVKDEGPPAQKDGESWEEFIERKAEYAGRRAAREEREKGVKEDGERKAAEQRKNSERDFKKRSDDYAKDHPDFKTKLETADDVMISNVMAEELQDSPFSAHMLDYLVDHPDESARIAGLSPREARREMLKLEAKMEAGNKKPETKEDGDDGNDDQQGDDGKGGNKDADQSPERRGDGTFKSKRSAPDPIEPGSARSATTNSAPSDKDDMKTWAAKREAQLKKERGR